MHSRKRIPGNYWRLKKAHSLFVPSSWLYLSVYLWSINSCFALRMYEKLPGRGRRRYFGDNSRGGMFPKLLWVTLGMRVAAPVWYHLTRHVVYWLSNIHMLKCNRMMELCIAYKFYLYSFLRRLMMTEIFSLALCIISVSLIFEVINMEKCMLCIFIVTFPSFKHKYNAVSCIFSIEI